MTESPRSRPSAPALVLALAVPILCLHRQYTPSLDIGLGSTSVTISLADVAVLAVAAAALWRGRRDGFAPLARGRWLWAATLVFVAFVLASALWGPAVTEGYPSAAKLVSAAKVAEYALLALAVPLIVRATADALAVVVALAATSTAATIGGLLQFIGLLGNLDQTPGGRRMPSFLGYHDFAALSGVALLLGVTAIVFHPTTGRRLTPLVAAAGLLGGIIAGSVAATAAVAVAAILLLAFGHVRQRTSLRQAAVVAALVVTLCAGTVAIRSADVFDFLAFLDDETPTQNVQTYSHRTLLTYLGIRIFADHPVLGTGWQGSELPASFEPYLADAHRRFPGIAPEAFPSEERLYGVQNAYVQAGADMGVGGLLALLALLAVGLALAVRGALARPRRSWDVVSAAGACLGTLVVVAATLAALGLVPGVPTIALLWLALGSAAALPTG